MPRMRLDQPLRVYSREAKSVVMPPYTANDGSRTFDEGFYSRAVDSCDELDNKLPRKAFGNREVRSIRDAGWKQFRGVHTELRQQIEALEEMVRQDGDEPDDLLNRQILDNDDALEVDDAVCSPGHKRLLEFIADLDRCIRLADAIYINEKMDVDEHDNLSLSWPKKVRDAIKKINGVARRANNAHRRKRDEERQQKQAQAQKKSQPEQAQESGDETTAESTKESADSGTGDEASPEVEATPPPAQSGAGDNASQTETPHPQAGSGSSSDAPEVETAQPPASSGSGDVGDDADDTGEQQRDGTRG